MINCSVVDYIFPRYNGDRQADRQIDRCLGQLSLRTSNINNVLCYLFALSLLKLHEQFPL